jgi:hypothetical protein
LPSEFQAVANWLDLINQNGQQTVHNRVDIAQGLNSLKFVAHSCVVSAVVGLADLCKAPTAYPLG